MKMMMMMMMMIMTLSGGREREMGERIVRDTVL
jgi:hypothetical protein